MDFDEDKTYEKFTKKNRSKPRNMVFTSKYLETPTSDFHNYHSDDIVRASINYIKKNLKPTKKNCITFLYERIPPIEWIPKYDVKQYLVKDLVGGLTLGIVQVPQCMAYSLAAGLPAYNGLYVTFFHCLLYFLFGTSRHISPGTYAIISLMVYTQINKYEGKLFPCSKYIKNGTVNFTNPDFISNDPVVARVMISTVLSMSSGILLLISSILHLGFLTKYLSDAIIGGLSIGAVFHVIMSQIKYVFGIQLDPLKTRFILLGTLIEIFSNLDTTNMAILAIAIIAFIILFVGKLINDQYSHKLPVPVPIEIIVVIGSTVISYFAEFDERWDVSVVGKIPVGFPAPTVPPINLFSKLLGDSSSIAILTFGLNVSFSQLFAKKYKYKISPNQELFAYGIGNVASSFFNGFPGCVGISRCFIGDGIGVKTQIVALINTIIVLVVILALGPLLATLPKSVLASLVIVALIQKIHHVTDFLVLFKKSKIEGLVWLVTFVAVIVFDVDIGLYVGLLSNLFIIIIKSQRVRCTILGNIPGTDIFESICKCKEAQEFKHIKIIRYEESVYYTNVDNFKYQITKFVGFDPEEVLQNIDRRCNKLYKKLENDASKQKKMLKKNSHVELEFSDYVFDQNGLIDIKENQKIIRESIKRFELKDVEIRNIILDCSCVNYIDSQGVQAIQGLYENYKELDVSLNLSYCKSSVQNSMIKYGLKNIMFEHIFLCTFRAMVSIFKKDFPDSLIIIGKHEKDLIKENEGEGQWNYPQSYYKPNEEFFTFK